tara:strand:- start:582 stop:1094 length:513 start_codon:yes stop_codon:yes gene_type:complete
MGAGILPVALYRGTLFLLLGQERHNNLWSDFGGSPHKGEKPYKTAIREGSEELNGFFGSEEELDSEVNDNKILSICYDKYTTYIFKTKYNRELPKYFNNNNKFIEIQATTIVDTKYNGLYEKKTIGWFPINKFKNEKNKLMLRLHYIEHINCIVKNEEYIIKEIQKLETY